MEPLECRQLLTVSFLGTPFGQHATTQNLVVNYNLSTTTAPFQVALVAVDDEDNERLILSQVNTAEVELPADDYSFAFDASLASQIGASDYLKVVLDYGGSQVSQTFTGAFRDHDGQIHYFGTSSTDVVTASESGSNLILSAGGTSHTYSFSDSIGVSGLKIWGRDGADTLLSSGHNVSVPLLLSGGKGEDTLYAGSANATIDGGEGNDALYAGNNTASTYTLRGGNNTDVLTGGAGTNNMDGGGSADTIYAGSGDNSIAANSDADQVIATDSSGSVDLYGSGSTTLTLRFTQAVSHTVEFADASEVRLGAKTFSYSGLGKLAVELGSAADVLSFAAQPIHQNLSISNPTGANDTISLTHYVGGITLNSASLKIDNSTIGLTSNQFSLFNVIGSANSDVLTLNEPSGGLLPSVTFSGNGGTDTIVINRAGVSSAQVVSITASNARYGSTTVSYSSIAQLSVTTGSGNDTFNVTHSASLPILSLNGGSHSSGDKLSITSSASSAETIGIDSSKVVHAGKTVNFSNIENVSVTSGSGNDTFNVAHSTSLPVLTLNGGSHSSGDVLSITSSASSTESIGIDSSKVVHAGKTINFSNIENVSVTSGSNADTFAVTHSVTLPTLTLNGDGNANDVLTVDATGSSAQSVTVDATKVVVSGRTINFSAIENISVITGTESDTFTVLEPASSSLPSLTFNPGSGSADHVIFDGQANTSSLAINIDSAKVTMGGSTLNYSQFDRLWVLTGSTNDTFTVTAAASGPLLPEIHVEASGGTDRLIVADQRATNQTASITGFRVGLPSIDINYDAVENVSLTTAGGNDQVSITRNATDPALPGSISVDLGAGENELQVLDISTTALAVAVTVAPSTIQQGTTTITYAQADSLYLKSTHASTTISRPTGTSLPSDIRYDSGYIGNVSLDVNLGDDDDFVTQANRRLHLSRTGNFRTTVIEQVQSSKLNLNVNSFGGQDTIRANFTDELSTFYANGGTGSSDRLYLRDPLSRIDLLLYIHESADYVGIGTSLVDFEVVQADRGSVSDPIDILRDEAAVAWSLSGDTLGGPTPATSLAGTTHTEISLTSGDTFTYTAQLPGIAQSSLTNLELSGPAGSPVTILGSSGDDVFEIGENTIRVNGGPLISLPTSPYLLVDGGDGNDTFYVRHSALLDWVLTSLEGSAGNDTLDFSGVDMTGESLWFYDTFETINLSRTNLSSVPTIASSVTTLDLRYNNLNLEDVTELNPLSSNSTLRQLYLYGNQGAVPDLQGIKGKLLRVDLAPVGLAQAEVQSSASDALDGIVKALHYLPLEIYDYLVNEYDHQLYVGLVKGDLGTIRTHAGNDLDLANLLVELLSRVNVTATMKSASHTLGTNNTGVTVPIETMQKWLGVETVNAMEDALSTLPHTRLLDPGSGDLAEIAMTHTFVEATIGGQTAKLDPSWKQYDVYSNFDRFLAEYNTQNGTSWTSLGEIVSDVTINGVKPNLFVTDATNNPFINSPYYASPTDQVAFEWFEDQAARWLAINAPGMTLADAGYQRVIQPIYSTAASIGSLPYTLAGAASTTNVSNQRQKVRVTLQSVANPTTKADIDLNLVDVSQSELIVRPTGTNPRIIGLYQDGVLKGSSVTLPAADTTFDMSFGFFMPNQSLVGNRTYRRSLGTVMAIGIEANQINEQMLAAKQQQVNDDGLTVLDAQSISSFGTAQIGHLLSLAIHRFFRRTDQGQEAMDSLFRTTPLRNDLAGGVVSSQSDLTYQDNVHPDLPIAVVPNKLFVDVKKLTATSTSIYGDENARNWRIALASASSSSQESAIFEELVNGSAISTVKGFQLARSAGIPLKTFVNITSANHQTVRNELTAAQTGAANDLTAAEIDQIGDFVEASTETMTLVLPAKRSTLLNWDGYVYFAATNSSQSWVINGTGGFGLGGGPAEAPRSNPTIFPQVPKFVADPVNIANGALAEDMIDIQIPAPGIPLTFARHYESTFADINLPVEKRGDPTLGLGWFASYSDRLVFDGSNVNWIDNQGRQFLFTWNGSGYNLPDLLKGNDFRKDASNNYTYRDKSGIARKFNSAGYLIQISDLNGNALNIARNAGQGYRITTVTSNSTSPNTTNATLTFGYDGSGRLSSISDGSRTWTYSVTAIGGQNFLTEVAGPQDPVTKEKAISRYGYDTTAPHSQTPVANLMISKSTIRRWLDANNVAHESTPITISHTYYPDGSVFQAINPDGSRQTFQFNPYRRLTTFIDERSNSTQHSFDAEGRQTRVTYADRSYELDEWNSIDQRQAHVDVFGVRTAYTYDGTTGNLTTATQQKPSINWATGTVSWSTLQMLDRNAAGNMVLTSMLTSYGYETRSNASGLLFSKLSTVSPPSAITGARNVVNDYDDLTGNLLTTTETRFNPVLPETTYLTKRFSYGAHGNLWKATDARGGDSPGQSEYTTTYSDYNNLGQAQTVTYFISNSDPHAPTQAVEHATFNAYGAQTSFTDRNLNTTDYIVDILGRRTETWQPTVNGSRPITTYRYDERGNIISMVDSENRTTTYTFDVMDRLLETRSHDGTRTQSIYDLIGNVVAVSDGLGNVTRARFDQRNRSIQTTLADRSYTIAGYNGANQPMIGSDANRRDDTLTHATTYRYDQLGRMTEMRESSVWDATGQQPVLVDGRHWSYQYDAMGNRTQQKLNVTNADQITNYIYDSLGRLAIRQDPQPSPEQDTPVWWWLYDAAGNVNQSNLGPVLGDQYRTTNKQINGLNHVVVEMVYPNFEDTHFVRDAVGNVRFQTDPRNITTEFKYDALNRLTEKTVNYNQIDANKQDSPQTTFVYDKVGNLLETKLKQAGSPSNANQWRTVRTFDVFNRVTSETRYNIDGTTILSRTQSGYDAAGNLILFVDARGYSTRYEYDARNRLVKTTNALGGTTRTSYDANGNVLTATDERGHTTVNQYDAANRLLTQELPDPNNDAVEDSPLKTYEYNKQTGNLERQYFGEKRTSPDVDTSEKRRQTDFVYDKLNRLIKTTEADDDPLVNSPDVTAADDRRFSEQRYDVAGNVIWSKDVGGAITTYTYEGRNRLETRTEPDPDGGAGPGLARKFTYEYDGSGNVELELLEDVNGVDLKQTTHTYDGADRMTSTSRVAVVTTGGFTAGNTYSSDSTKYDAAGNVVSHTDAEGRWSTSSYDGLNRVTGTIDYDFNPGTGAPTIRALGFTYDAAGNLLTSTNHFDLVSGFSMSDNRTSTYAYDSLNRQIRASDPLYNTTTTAYDAVGNVVKTVDPLGQKTTFIYDNLNRRTDRYNDKNERQQWFYDELNLTDFKDHNEDNHTAYLYDGLDRLIKETKVGLGETHYRYDVRDNVKAETERLAIGTAYTASKNVREFVFDAYGRKTQEVWKNSSQTVVNTIGYTYAPDDQLTSVTDVAGPNITYSYNDPIRRLASTTTLLDHIPSPQENVTLKFSYNLVDEVMRENIDFASDNTRDYALDYAYDYLGRMSFVTQSAADGQGSTLANPIGARFKYNPASQLTGITRYNVMTGVPGGGDIFTDYEYDPAGRLVEINHTGPGGQQLQGYEYEYDPAGRILRKTTSTPENTERLSYSYDSIDQLTRVVDGENAPQESYGYDASGNRLGSTHDDFNRLTSDGTFNYYYNLDGTTDARTRQSVPPGLDHVTNYNWDQRDRLNYLGRYIDNVWYETTYTYDAFNRRAVKADNDTPSQFQAYIYSGAALRSTFGIEGTQRFLPGPGGMILAVDRDSTGEHSWLLADHQGSINRVVDDTGAVEGDIRYNSFGVVTSADTPETLDILVGYTGQVFDVESGLHYFNARYYDPKSGRFLSEDPTGFAGGDGNLYRYVGNNAVNLIDPTGLMAKALGGMTSAVGVPGLGLAGAVANGISYIGRELGAGFARASQPAPTPQAPMVQTRSAPLPLITANYTDEILGAQARAHHARNMELQKSTQFNSYAVGAATFVGNVVGAVDSFFENMVYGAMDFGTAIFEDAPNQFVVQHVTGRPIELRSQAVKSLDGKSYAEGFVHTGTEYAKGVSRYNHAEATINYALDPSAENGARLQQESLTTGSMLLPFLPKVRRPSGPGITNNTIVGSVDEGIQHFVPAYRVVENAELADLYARGKFYAPPESLSPTGNPGKWFYLFEQDALDTAAAWSAQGGGPFTLIPARVPSKAITYSQSGVDPTSTMPLGKGAIFAEPGKGLEDAILSLPYQLQ